MVADQRTWSRHFVSDESTRRLYDNRFFRDHERPSRHLVLHANLARDRIEVFLDPQGKVIAGEFAYAAIAMCHWPDEVRAIWHGSEYELPDSVKRCLKLLACDCGNLIYDARTSATAWRDFIDDVQSLCNVWLAGKITNLLEQADFIMVRCFLRQQPNFAEEPHPRTPNEVIIARLRSGQSSSQDDRTQLTGTRFDGRDLRPIEFRSSAQF